MIQSTLLMALLSLICIDASEPDVRPDTLDPKVRVSVEEATLGSGERSATAQSDRDSEPAECRLDMRDPQNPCGLLPFYETPPDVEADLDPGTGLAEPRQFRQGPSKSVSYLPVSARPLEPLSRPTSAVKQAEMAY